MLSRTAVVVVVVVMRWTVTWADMVVVVVDGCYRW